MGLSVNQGDRQTHSLARSLSLTRTHSDDFAVCVSTDGKPCDIVVLCSSGRGGGSLRSETQSAWWVCIFISFITASPLWWDPIGFLFYRCYYSLPLSFVVFHSDLLCSSHTVLFPPSSPLNLWSLVSLMFYSALLMQLLSTPLQSYHLKL